MLLACFLALYLYAYLPTLPSHPKLRTYMRSQQSARYTFKFRCIELHRFIHRHSRCPHSTLFVIILHVHLFHLPNHSAQPDLGSYQMSFLTYTHRARPSVHRLPACCIRCVHTRPSWSPVLTEAVDVTASRFQTQFSKFCTF